MVPNTLRDIYYNSGDTHTSNNVFHMNDNELMQYLNRYNKINNTNYNYKTVKYDITFIKKYPGKLYKGEYSRSGELEYLRDFCNVDNSIIFTDNMYKKTSYNGKENYRLMSYNIHSFINSCNSIKDNMMDTRNVKEILELCSYLKPDILAFQEYSPVFLDKKELNVMNFIDTYIDKIDPRMIDSNMYNGISNSVGTFLGNMTMSIFKMDEKINLSLLYKKNESRPFVGSKINIEGIDLYMFNIHPVAEYDDISQYNSMNFKQIKWYVDMISLKYPPNKYNIVICGDYNNSNNYLKEYMNKKLFRTVHDFYQKDTESFTGYHGSYLDFIYVSYHFIYDFTIVDHSVITVNYSDHYPVMFDFRVNDKMYIKSQLETLTRYDDYNYILNYNKFNEYNNNNTALTKEEVLKLLDENMNELLDTDTIKTLLNKSIVNIPAGTFLVHGTDYIVPNGNYNGIFELDEYHTDKNIKLEVPRSFTLLHFPNESFMSWYGIDSEVNLKRLIIYKTTKDIKMINLYDCGDTLKDRVTCRLDSYLKLYNYYKDRFNFPEIYKPDYIVSDRGFNVMRFLWPIFNHQLLVNINTVDDKYNKQLFYGIICADTIQNDFAFFKKNLNHDNSTTYWKKSELYEGIEIQLFVHHFFTEIQGVYCKNKFYTIDEWENYVQLLLQKINTIKNTLNMTKKLSLRSYEPNTQSVTPIEKNTLIKNSIKKMFKFILNLIESDYYNDNIEGQVGNLLKNILNKDDMRLSLNHPFSIKLLFNDFLLSLSHTIDFYQESDKVIEIKTGDFNNMNIIDSNKDYFEELYFSFGKYLIQSLSVKYKSRPNDNKTKIIKTLIKNTIIFICTNYKTRFSMNPVTLIQMINNTVKKEDLVSCFNTIINYIPPSTTSKSNKIYDDYTDDIKKKIYGVIS